MNYQLIQHNLNVYEVSKNGEPIGRIQYRKVLYSEATILLNNIQYVVECKNFFKTKFIVRKGGTPVAEITQNWLGKFKIRAINKGESGVYFLKQISRFRTIYRLINYKQESLFTMRIENKFGNSRSKFSISVTEKFEEEQHTTLLLFLALFLINKQKVNH